jgi:hypothetical protein
MDVGQRYGEAALVLRREIQSVIKQTEQATGTIASSFEAVINKATIQARQAMELLEGTQGAASDGVPQSLKDFIQVSDERLNKMADEVVRVADLSVNMVRELDGVQNRTQAIDGFLLDVEKPDQPAGAKCRHRSRARRRARARVLGGGVRGSPAQQALTRVQRSHPRAFEGSAHRPQQDLW